MYLITFFDCRIITMLIIRFFYGDEYENSNM